MRKPGKRKSKIDDTRVAKWQGRFASYARRTITNGSVRDWLGLFDEPDRDTAARVLDAVDFVDNERIERGIRTMMGRMSGWAKDAKKRTGKWRFVSFSPSPGKSGDAMLPVLRNSLALSPSKYNDLFIGLSDLVLADLGPEDTVVFIDDFSGSGDQVCNFWQETLEELLSGEPKAYLLLIASASKARDRIHEETGLQVRAGQYLKKEDDIFSSHCKHFTAAERGQLLNYCKKANSKSPRGWRDCGFVIVLAHKTPNNSIPILHANTKKWKGLFPRHTDLG